MYVCSIIYGISRAFLLAIKRDPTLVGVNIFTRQIRGIEKKEKLFFNNNKEDRIKR